MFDALRRAESERKRKQEESTPAPTALERVPASAPARDAVTPEAPAMPRSPRREAPAPVSPMIPGPALPVAAPGVDPFPREMLRELGILRNSIESKLEKKTSRVLMFTSAMHGEGVTTLALAYARLVALHNEHRVLLIELNARTPALAARLGLTSLEGVTDYFAARRSLASLVSRPAGESFDVMHVGAADATQIQINLERAFPHLVEEALRSYDTVVVDAPPVVVCPETTPLSPFVDGTVLVVHSGRTKRETVERSVKQIQQFQGRVLGVVLNRKRYYIPHFIYKRL
jgi:Mrp family chromosome partitioning ATPase